MIQMIYMGHRLYQGKTIFPRTNLALEQRRKTLCRAAGLVQMVKKPRKGSVMIVNQLRHAVWQTKKGQLVPAQRKVIGPRKRRKPFAGFQPFSHRVSHWFGRVDPDIGADRRQDLITCDHQIVIATSECCVLWCVAVAHVDVPVATSHTQHVALFDAGKP